MATDIITGRESEEKKYISESSYITSIPGLIKNAEGKINGIITYAHITIRKK